MKILYVLLLLPLLCIGNSSLNLSIPSAGSTYGQDSIRTSDGLDCKNAIGGATQFEMGVTGIINNDDGSTYSEYDSSSNEGSGKNVGVYARIVIPLDKPRQRINCNSLYQLELRKKRLEVLKLEQEIEMLKKVNSGKGFEN